MRLTESRYNDIIGLDNTGKIKASVVSVAIGASAKVNLDLYALLNATIEDSDLSDQDIIE